jgi:integrase
MVVPSHARKYLDYALRHASGSGLYLFEPWYSIRRDLHVAARLLSMCPACRQVNVAWARHEVGAIKPDHSRACRLCKTTPPFPPLSPNDLRRTFAQWLVRSGVPYELAYPLMGHSSPRMLQQVYGKRDATAVADLIELALKKAPKGARKRAG